MQQRTEPFDECLLQDFTQTLLNVSLTGIIIFKPVYDLENDQIIDLSYIFLNPSAQQMLQLPERPKETFLALYPNAINTGIFAFYRDTFLSGKKERYDVNYQYDGLDNYFHLAAQRSGDYLVVNFTDTSDHDRTAVEKSLRESQAREKAARAEADLQRSKLYNIFMQAPAMICIFEGPDHKFKFVNPSYQMVVGKRSIIGLPIAEAMPELKGQTVFDLLDQVYNTGESYSAYEMLIQLDHFNKGELGQNYYNFVYQAIKNLDGCIEGILVFAYEVTEQVTARKKVQELNGELAASNEELVTINSELIATQNLLHTLNNDLEKQVAYRTEELEAALLKTELQKEQLIEQKDFLTQILGNVPASIATLSGPQHRYSFFNDQYHKLAGYRTQLNLTVAEVFPEVVEQGFIELLNNVYKTGKSFIGTETPALLYNPETGKSEQFYLDFIYQPLIGIEKQVTGILVFVIDSTEKVVARLNVQNLNVELASTNEELIVTNEDLESINRQLTITNNDLDTFIYTASHDLKAPISNIEGLMNLLLKLLPTDVLNSEQIFAPIEMMQESIDRFKRTIGNMTDVIKFQKENNKGKVSVDVGKVINEVILDLDQLIKDSGTKIEIDLSDCHYIYFSEKNLRSIFYNLISNGIKYSSPDKVPQIKITCRNSNDHNVITVADNGLGISKTQLTHLFTMFKRFHNHVDGTGIGLYIIKRMIESAGGRIEVTSNIGEGSTFIVYIKN